MATTYSKTYFPNLDATRFVAFLAVLLEHVIVTDDSSIKQSSAYSFYERHFHLASLGVGYFIVLSGFLITWIILEEYKNTDKFNLSFFWFRRCLRIWPLYFLLILLGYAAVFFKQNLTGCNVHDLPSLIWVITFTLNFYIINHGQAFLFFIVFLWSISVEEQLYVLWGLALKWLKPLFLPFCILLLAASLAFRIFIHDNANLYFNTLNWVPHFALGALVAYMANKECSWYNWLKNIPRAVIISVYLLFAVNLALYNHIYASASMTIIQRHIDALFFAFFVFEQNFCTHRLFNLGKSPKMNYLGKISYGLFCYHGLVILLFTKILAQSALVNNSLCVFLINPLLIFALTVIVAAISYRYFETPIMQLRTRFKTS